MKKFLMTGFFSLTALLPCTAGADSMAGMDMSMPMPMPEQTQTQKTPPPVPQQPPSPAPAPAYPGNAAAPADMAGMEHDDSLNRFFWLRAEELEAARDAGTTTYQWDGDASWGSSLRRVWLASRGERPEQGAGRYETQLYGSQAFTRWWDATLGVRNDNGPEGSRQWLSLGVRGLAPYWFDTKATVFVRGGGQAALRLHGRYELLFTNRLILQLNAEGNFNSRTEAQAGEGGGLADTTIGARLRYEWMREVAPYAGVEWTQRYGRSADFAAQSGERVHGSAVVAGLRLWY